VSVKYIALSMAAASQSVLRINFLHKCVQPAFKVRLVGYVSSSRHAGAACMLGFKNGHRQVQPSIFLLHCKVWHCVNEHACSDLYTAYHGAFAMLALPPSSTSLNPNAPPFVIQDYFMCRPEAVVDYGECQSGELFGYRQIANLMQVQ